RLQSSSRLLSSELSCQRGSFLLRLFRATRRLGRGAEVLDHLLGVIQVVLGRLNGALEQIGKLRRSMPLEDLQRVEHLHVSACLNAHEALIELFAFLVAELILDGSHTLLAQLVLEGHHVEAAGRPRSKRRGRCGIDRRSRTGSISGWRSSTGRRSAALAWRS